jgi:predicted ester cyclase
MFAAADVREARRMSDTTIVPTSTAEANATCYRRLIELLVEQRYDELGSVFTEDAVLHTFPDPRPSGLRDSNAPAFAAFPDWAGEIENLVASDTHVGARLVWHGTHRGELFGIAPTGRQVAVEEVEIARFRDGRIAEIWNVFDFAGLVAQVSG